MNYERFRSALRIARNVTVAAALTTAGTAAVPGVAGGETSAATVRSYSCNPTKDTWQHLTKGEIVVINASGAVVPADETVDGIKWYDDNADTSTVLGVQTRDNTKKTFVIINDNEGSVLLKKCGAPLSSTRASVGEQTDILDARLGVNDPNKSVQTQWYKK